MLLAYTCSPASTDVLLFVFVQDLDEMDADLFGPKKNPTSAPAKTKSLGNGGPKVDLPKLDGKFNPRGTRFILQCAAISLDVIMLIV